MASSAVPITQPLIACGNFPSASTAVDEVITCGFTPKMVILVIDVDATAPELVFGYNHADVANSADVVNHDTTPVLSTVLASSIHTYTATGFTIDATKQNDSGDNFYIIFG